MSRLAMYATAVCMSLTMVFAAESIGQRKLLKDIPIEFTLTKTMSLQDLIDEVERSGKFTFVYSRKDIRGITLAFNQPVGSMEDLLNEISIQARVSIKRVNETISFKNVVQDAAMPQVFDEVPVQVSISGKVTDETGEALIGAAVLEKGTTNGTITDIDGNYQLTVGDGAVLQISFVGYQSIEIPVNNRTTINPQLQLDTEQLDEIVVVGYGTVRKSDVTGSVSSIDTDKLQKEGVNSIDQLLQNAASGVQVVQNSAEP
ncbi:MAG: carboxypeptidase-like regulatory domain-containing protein, partial [Cyclobacteriaceae bacterium]|nr:carboxypeptidase-like regulatory domain-containing protein [Cyclobacteriaceae bacterium SS2]